MVRVIGPNDRTAQRDGVYKIERPPSDDDTYGVVMTPFLDDGEVVTALTTGLFRIVDDFGDVSVDESDLLEDAPDIVGVQAQQRIRDVLEAGEIYRLWFYIGVAPNLRGFHVIIECLAN